MLIKNILNRRRSRITTTKKIKTGRIQIVVPKINRLSIKNKKRFLPEGLVYIYCREILDDDTHCTYAKDYCFMHILLPKDFTDTEISHINK